MRDDWTMGQLADEGGYVMPLNVPAPFATEALPPLPEDPFERAAITAQSRYRNRPAEGQSNVPVVAEALIPQEPWEFGLMAAVPGGGIIGAGARQLPKLARMGALAAGIGVTASEAEAKPKVPKGFAPGSLMDERPPPGIGHNQPPVADPKLRAKASALEGTYPQYMENYPEIGPPNLRAKMPDPKNPGKFLSKAEKEIVPYSSMEEALAKDAEPGFFLEKQLLPEVEKFQKARAIVQKDMDVHGYEPYFDPGKRTDVDPKNYGPFRDTGTEAAPKTAATDAEWYAKYGTPENRAKLVAGFEKGKTVPDSADWYFMGQLEQEYIKHLGPEAGRKAFKTEFGDMMAATTGGAAPYDNFLMAQYANYMAKRGERMAERGYKMPFPIGGRFASGNIKQAQDFVDEGMQGFDPAVNPKRYDFSSAFAGNRNAATIDEQMYQALRPTTTKASVNLPEWYGPATRVAREEAAKLGLDARGFQDVGWAGLKKGKVEAKGDTFDYEGPMINHINRSIETTSRMTGMPREEVVRRGLILKEIPMYGMGGLAVMGGVAAQDRYRQQAEPEGRL